jgi:hypothetical protein
LLACDRGRNVIRGRKNPQPYSPLDFINQTTGTDIHVTEKDFK